MCWYVLSSGPALFFWVTLGSAVVLNSTYNVSLVAGTSLDRKAKGNNLLDSFYKNKLLILMLQFGL